MEISLRSSPHHNARPAGVAIDTLVIHADASRTVASTLAWLESPDSKVSYHFLLGRTGAIYQLVDPARRAWHAGKSVFDGREDVNDFSIGVSLSNQNDGVEPYPQMQVKAAAQLCAELMRRYPKITPERITTHAAISPGRKTDPGPRFDLPAFIALVKSIP